MVQLERGYEFAGLMFRIDDGGIQPVDAGTYQCVAEGSGEYVQIEIIVLGR